jgi:hypothetical protein
VRHRRLECARINLRRPTLVRCKVAQYSASVALRADWCSTSLARARCAARTLDLPNDRL